MAKLNTAIEPHTEIGQMKANREAFGETLVRLGKSNSKVVVFDADVCTSTMTSLFRDAFPERFFQMGIAEQNMMSAAAGLSTVGGLIPWVSTFAVFASKRAADQVSISVAYPRNNVKINGSYGGIPTGNAGATHQAVEDIAIMRAMPNMVVIVPVDAVEVEQAMEWATAYKGPVYLRTTRHKTRIVLDWRSYKFEPGKVFTLREGKDITLVGTGVMTVLALDTAEALAREGIGARVLHVPTLKPLDASPLVKAARETKGFITMENHTIIGGLGGAVAEVLCDRSPAIVKRLGFPDVFGESGDDEKIFGKLGLSVENAVKTARELMRKKLFVFFLAVLLAGAAWTSNAKENLKPGPLETVDYVDIARFMGTWYVIASIPISFEKDGYNAIESYTWNAEKDRIDIDYRFNKGSFDGKLKKLPQKAWIHDERTNAEWRIQLLWPLKFAHLVIDLGEEYEFTVIGVPNRKNIWIMAREPWMDEDLYASILEKARTRWGYDLEDLRKVPHRR